MLFFQGSCGGPCGALPPNPSKSCIFEVQLEPTGSAVDVKPIPNVIGDNLNIDGKADIQSQLSSAQAKLGPTINIYPTTATATTAATGV